MWRFQTIFSRPLTVLAVLLFILPHRFLMYFLFISRCFCDCEVEQLMLWCVLSCRDVGTFLAPFLGLLVYIFMGKESKESVGMLGCWQLKSFMASNVAGVCMHVQLYHLSGAKLRVVDFSPVSNTDLFFLCGFFINCKRWPNISMTCNFCSSCFKDY